MSHLLSGRLKDRLAGSTSFGLIWLSLGHPAVAEIAAHCGAGAVVFDLQHGLWDKASYEAAAGLAIGRVPVMARVAQNTPFAIGSALDAGVDGVLVPMVETVEQAAQAVSSACFPPHGIRSGGGVRPLATGFADYLDRADGIAVGVMIETTTGVDNAGAIAAVPGLDFVLIGTGDLAIACAASGGGEDAVGAACTNVLNACTSAGVPCGIFTTDVRQAAERRDEGYRLVVLANDIDVVRRGFADAAKSFEAVE